METDSGPSTVRDASGGLDWAGRGTSHVDFDPNETLPLSQGRFLGHGVNGGVFETTVCEQKVAWKRQFCRRRIAKEELGEIAILKKIDGRHIIKLVGTYTHGPFLGLLLSPVAVCDLGTFLEDVNSLLHRSEDVELDHQAIQQRLDGLGIRSSLPPIAIQHAALKRLKQSIGCISSAIAYLHRGLIRHKDIKPSNILLSSSSGLWVTDFGTSTDFSNVSQSLTNNGERGTPKYFAPEVAEFELNGRSADIFSLACVFLELIGLCNGYSLEQMKSLRPAKDFSFHANLESILHWFNFSGTKVASVADSQLMALVREMLIRVPNERPTAMDIEIRLQLIDVFRSPSADPLWGECCAPVSESSRQVQHLQVSSVSIRLGNTHHFSDMRHNWNFFIYAPAVQDLISDVHCFLHSSFEHPYTVKNLPPFEWAGSGWGFFTISIIIALKPGYSWISPLATVGPCGHSLLPLTWTLNFEQELTYQEFEVDLAAL
ncbi:kinase-like protein [Hyaloscypha variabilis]